MKASLHFLEQMEIHPVSHHYQTGYMKRELIIIGIASYKQYYTHPVINVYPPPRYFSSDLVLYFLPFFDLLNHLFY